MGVAGSIGINVGQNLQASGLRMLPLELRTKPHKSRKWILGMAIFVAFSMLNFVALAFAPASVLTPLESIQFVTNIVYNKYVNQAVVSQRMLIGVALALLGTVLSVVFGASGDGCHTLAELEAFWLQPIWWVYLIGSLVVALAAWLTHRAYAKALAKEAPLPRYQLVMPVTFTLAAALAGGAQMIVHSKVFSELLALLVTAQSGEAAAAIFTHWLLYVEVVLVTSCGIVWAFKLTECLALFDPLLILPLMVGTYILWGGIAGGIFFKEYARLHEGYVGYAGWGLYVAGVLSVLAGLCLIAVADAEVEQKLEETEVVEGGLLTSDLVHVPVGVAEDDLPRPPPIEVQTSEHAPTGAEAAVPPPSTGTMKRRRHPGGEMPTPGAMRAFAKQASRASQLERESTLGTPHTPPHSRASEFRFSSPDGRKGSVSAKQLFIDPLTPLQRRSLTTPSALGATPQAADSPWASPPLWAQVHRSGRFSHALGISWPAAPWGSFFSDPGRSANAPAEEDPPKTPPTKWKPPGPVVV